MAFRPLSPIDNLLGSIAFGHKPTMAQRLRAEEMRMETAPPDLREIQGIPSHPATQAGLKFAHPEQSDISPRLATALNALSDILGEDLDITSGHRSAARNKAVKGATRSYHLASQGAVAADINMAGWSPAKRQQAVRELARLGVTNFITYTNIPDMIHVDLRPKKPGAPPSFMFKTRRGKYSTTLGPGWFRDIEGQIRKGTFPEAPSGQTGWPTPPEKGPGIYGAINPETRAQQYAAAGNRRSYEQGFRPAPAATPQDFSIRPQFGPPISAMERPQFGPPISAMERPQFGPPISAMERPQFGPPMSAMQRPQQGPPAPTPNYGAPSGPVVGSGGIVGAGGPVGTGGIVGTGAPTIDVNAQMRTSKPRQGPPISAMQRPQQGPPAPAPAGGLFTGPPAALSRQDKLSAIKDAAAPPSTPSTVVDPAVREAAAVARATDMPDEARFSMKKGLTPEDKVKMGLTPAPAPDLPAAKVVKDVPVKEVQPAEQVTTTRVKTAPAPAIAPAAPPPAKPGGLIGALENLAAPFHTLANIAGSVPNPPSRSIGYGAEAIGSVLAGQAQAGDTAYSKSMPGFSIKDLGNGMIQKTNPFGHVSFEHVDKLGGGIFSGQPQPGGLLGGFGMPGLGSAIGGFFGGMGTAPAAGGGGMFGGWGGGGTSTGGSRRGGTSSGGRGSMSAGSGGMSKSTRY